MSATIKDYGYIRVGACTPTVAIGNTDSNRTDIERYAEMAVARGVSILVTPELSLTGYTCADLFGQELLLRKAIKSLQTIAASPITRKVTLLVGLPLSVEGKLYNCAAVISNNRICGIVPKTHIPNYCEFYEKRWFASGADCTASEVKIGNEIIPFGTDLLFTTDSGACFGAEICEDLWVPVPPSASMAMAGADIIFNLSASDETIGKHKYLLQLIKSHSAATRCGYIYASAGEGESSTDLVFSGKQVIAEDGTLLAESERFVRGSDRMITADIDLEQIRHDRRVYNSFGEHTAKSIFRTIRVNTPDYTNPEINGLLRTVDPTPMVPADKNHLDENCGEIASIQSWGLEQRLQVTNCKKLVVGISGGLDSTLAILIACKAFDRLKLDRHGIIAVTMPGEATTDRTRNNAHKLMQLLGVTNMEIPIGKAVAQHFLDINQDPDKHDAAYENSQARERTQLLMDLANKEGGMVLGTGDLSELALGWCTYNGDHMSMYGVNASVPKTLVSHMVKWFAEYHSDAATREVLLDIVDTPISPELIPGKDNSIAQKTEDLIGPYELHDFFLYYVLRHGSTPRKIFELAKIAFGSRYDTATLKKWTINFYRRFFSQQFKRSCMPDGPKTGSVCLSPRGDWRMPSDACSAIWMEEARNLPE